MLLEFTVENYLSIKEPITLSMIASKQDKDNCENIINPELLEKSKAVLKSAVIYGANASGKSNVIKAFGFMREFIIEKSKNILPIDPTKTVPFKFDEETPKLPSRFEVTFIQDEIKYFYGFSLDNDKIYEEYLYHYPKEKQAVVFERKNTTEYKNEKKSLTKITSENKLYLITLAQNNDEISTKVLEWFSKLQFIKDDDLHIANTILKLHQNPKLIINMLKSIDTGITDIKVEETDLEQENPRERLIEIRSVVDKIALSKSKNDIIKANIIFKHEIKNKSDKSKIYELSFQNESMGTKKFFKLLGIILGVIENNRILIIDELDISFHSELTKAIIKLFHSQNSKAQLIFTTHDAIQLSLKQFRKDQIYITEKDREQQFTKLYSLFDVTGIRAEENIQKGYLKGKYGGIPFIDIEGIKWQNR